MGTYATAGAELRANIAASRSDATRRSYDAAWRAFCRFAKADGQPPLGAPGETVALYLSTLGEEASPATVRLHAAAIAAVYTDAALVPPTQTRVVMEAIKGHANRRGTAQAQARPVDAEAEAAILAAAPRRRIGRAGRLETAATAARRSAVDVALIRTMRDALLRRAEAAALVWADIEGAGDGSGRLTVRRSKTDQAAAGAVLWLSPATMTALARLPGAWAIPEMRVFGLSGSQICRRIASAARAAGLGGGFSGHSPRVGMALDLIRHGCELGQVMQAGRWQSERMVARYTRNELAARGAVAQMYREAK